MKHLTTNQIERYAKRDLSAEERLEISDHLAVCPECRQQIKQARTAAPAAVRTAPPTPALLEPDEEHLSYEEIVDFIEARGAPAFRELAEGHIAECALCAEEVQELRAFRATLSTFPDTDHAPQSPPTWQERLRAAVRLPALRTGLQLGGGALVGACLMLLVLAKRPPQPPPTGDDRALRQARNEAEQARQAQAIASVALTQERTAHDETKQQLHGVTQQRDQLQNKVQRIASARPRPGEIVTDATGKQALVVPVGAAESQALASRQIKMPEQIASLQGGHVQMSGTPEPQTVTLLEPMGTFVPSLRPTLRWKPYPKAAQYEVRVVDVASNTTKARALLEQSGEKAWKVQSFVPTAEGERAETSTTANGTEWTLPASLALEPDKAYRWTVTARDAQGTVLAKPSTKYEARFRTLSAGAQKDLESKQALYADSPLLLGLLYARYGLLPQAEQALQQYLKTHPKDKEANSLLQQVRQQSKKNGSAP